MDKLSTRWSEKRLFYVLNLFLVLSGLGFGILACYVLGDDKLALLEQFYSGGMGQIALASRGELAKTAIESNLYDLCKIAFLGLCIVGIPFISAVVFIKGFSVGFAISFIMTKTGASGFLVAIISIVIPKMIYLPALIMASSYAMSGSLQILRGSRYDFSRLLAGYCVTMITLALLMIIAGTAEGFAAIYGAQTPLN